MSDLPDSWVVAPLGELLAAIVGGGTPSKSNPDYFQGSIPFMTVKDMHERFIADTQDHITRQALESSASSLIPADTLVVASRMSLGKIARPQIQVAINQDLKALFLHEGINKTYIEYAWRAKELKIQAMGTGTTVKGIRLEDIRSLEIPVAPSSEQTRIADQLDRLLARIQTCNDRLNAIPALIKRFRQSVLAAATSGNLTEDWRIEHPYADMVSSISVLPSSEKARRGVSAEASPATDYVDSWGYPKTWWKGTAGSLLCKGVFKDLKDGNHGANHPVVSEFTETGLPFITAAQVDRFVINYDSAYKISGRSLEKIRVGFAKSGDVVLTHKGSVGRVGVIDRDCVLTPQTTYYRLNSEYVQSRYLMYFMASKPFSGQLDDIKSQTTRDFVPITQQYVLTHLLPPLEEQTEIVRRVETLFKLADRVEARYTAARDLARRLTPLLLAKAFRGELVPQNPDDESAALLLERIRESKARQVTQKKNGRSAKEKSMKKSPPSSLLEIVIRMGGDSFTFERLRDEASRDYESLKDELFTLLADSESGLTQIFDAETQSMKFKRVRK